MTLIAAGACVPAALRDGMAELRPLHAGEREPLRAVFAGLSPASRTDRYLTGVHHLTQAMEEALSAVDGRRHIAWLATVAGRPAGIARALHVAPATAELAFEVVDEHQGRGLGAALLDAVTTVAMMRGVRRVQATTLPSNHRSLRLFARMGLTLRASGGLLEGEAPLRLLEPPRVDRRAVLHLHGSPGSTLVIHLGHAPVSTRTAGRTDAC